LSFNTENIGGTRNWIKTINACRGKYIAFLDGDDYFTDKNKLQKQFDCLENDSNAVLCFHAVEELYENSDRINSIVRFSKNIFTIEDIFAGGWFIRTGTTFFRNGILPQNPPEWVYDFPYRYDTILHVLLLDKGYAVYIDESMSVWRKHTMGMSLILNENIVKNMLTEISMMKQVNLYTEKKYDIFVKRYCKNLYTGLFLYLAKTGLLFRRFRIFCESLIRMNWGLTFKRLSDRIKIL
jgi:glycosyltransferase involved in cell wall biosynthesis